MKIVFTGGATGGHFYPIIAIIEALHEIEEAEHLLPADITFISTNPFDKRMLFENNIEYKEVPTGKMRQYFDIQNFFDIFKTAFGVIRGLRAVYRIFPDIVFGKGGYASFPALFAAKYFKIPVVIHESDASPGRVNLWAGKFARAVAVSYPEAAKYFPEDKTVVTGQPIRREVLHTVSRGGARFLHLEEGRPTILVLGGSQGSQAMNEAILDALPVLLPKYQIIHQVGDKNEEEIKSRLPGILSLLPEVERGRYVMFPYLDDLALRMAAGAAQVIISRAGSTIFEIAVWGKPSILIPIGAAHGDHQHQHKNAYHYARTGAALVMEEANLTPHLIATEVDAIMEDAGLRAKMERAALAFGEQNKTAAMKIAKEILRIAYEHESR